MSAGWVAGATRAKALARRRIGAAAATDLARCPDLDSAVAVLAATAYGREVDPGQTLEQAQRGVARVVLWHVRILAGWLPPNRSAALRILASGFEIANAEERLRGIDRTAPAPLFQLGGLQTAAEAIAAARSEQEVRSALARSAWGDPGDDDPWSIRLGMRLSWMARAAAAVPGAGPWAAGATAVALARATLVEHRVPSDAAQRIAMPLVGTAWRGAGTLPLFAEALPRQASWVLESVEAAEDLWRAEAHWWARVAGDGFAMLRRPVTCPDPVVGCAAVLAWDAWRVRGALEVAARGGVGVPDALGVFDVLA